ncbi:MAG: sulfur carrier protein ThiS [Parafannyhessea umbonata]|jgi:sulfur carrier protein|uniref:sulfur carrier protein ThiS n=1 Tax=Parafannyhessea umbonata TaxID=604330 RepID=UPI0026EFC610|nr:sulfur carrier protein ThiS [Parafannyhessea umbonata]MDD6358820.1 sulfur carrier protein ThiS [Parafannyhessea umbonata]MDD6566567.1 sulfur carrier protein ThiS [Parafannyhessea umbonata]
MNITVGGKQRNVEAGWTLARLIEDEKVENPEYVTVAVNDAFVDHADFGTTELAEGDTVEFLYFMGGGR